MWSRGAHRTRLSILVGVGKRSSAADDTGAACDMGWICNDRQLRLWGMNRPSSVWGPTVEEVGHVEAQGGSRWKNIPQIGRGGTRLGRCDECSTPPGA
jgi:hypothetical protein